MTKTEKKKLEILYNDIDVKISLGLFVGASLPIIEHYRCVIGDLLNKKDSWLQFL